MMRNEKLLFLLKIILLAVPLIGLLGSYIYTDPFKVLYKYDSYFESGSPNYITLNGGFVAVETFLRNYPRNKYDSFIFGSSRSRFYQIAEWKKHIDAGQCFHFDALNESLYGMAKKFEFLQKRGVVIKNALIVFDAELLSQVTDNEGYLFKQHPMLTAESSYVFQLEFLKAYLNGKFLTALLDFSLSGKLRQYMVRDCILDDKPFSYNGITNEISFDYFEDMIGGNKDEYYAPRSDLFYKRGLTQEYSDTVIGDKQKEQLRYIKTCLDEQNTIYRIVISPLYNQKKMSPADYDILCRIFGADKVFDFSGINDLTSSIYNYYETSHYRPHVCQWILGNIY